MSSFIRQPLIIALSANIKQFGHCKKKQHKANVKLRAKLRNGSFFIADGPIEKRSREGIIDLRCVSVRAWAQREARREGRNDRNFNKGSWRGWLTSLAIRSKKNDVDSKCLLTMRVTKVEYEIKVNLVTRLRSRRRMMKSCSSSPE